MKHLIATAFLFATFVTYAQKSRKLIWSEEFNYSGGLDSSRWNYELGDGCPAICGWGNNELEFYTKDKTNVNVANGSLIIHAIKSNGKWTSGRITTQSKFNFTYGTIEFRAKLPAGKGTWPALWMLGEGIKGKGWPACGEIDVMEHVGKNPGVVQSALHSPSSFGNTVNKGDTKTATFADQFHVYGAHWMKDRIEFFVDGVIYYTYQPNKLNTSTWPFNEPFFIIINLAIGGNFGGPEVDPQLKDVHMEVDYVRVYE